MAMLDGNDMIVVPTPPPPGLHRRVERPPVGRAYSDQNSRVDEVTYLQSRPSHSTPVSSTPVLPADFLRYDQTCQNEFEDGINSSSDHHDR